MIKNSKQATVAKATLKDLQQQKQDVIANKHTYSPIRYELALGSLEGLITSLQEDICYYNNLLTNGFHCFKDKGIESISEILISARLAQRISQKELGNLIDINEQQIQRYEQTDYEGASLVRLLEVAEALNIKLEFKDIMVLGKQPDFKLPSNMVFSDVEFAEERLKESGTLVL